MMKLIRQISRQCQSYKKAQSWKLKLNKSITKRLSAAISWEHTLDAIDYNLIDGNNKTQIIRSMARAVSAVRIIDNNLDNFVFDIIIKNVERIIKLRSFGLDKF